MVFSVEFEKVLDLYGFEGILWWIVVIFDGLKSGEMLDFSGVARSGNRSDFEVKCRGNVDFTMGLWIEQIYRSWLPISIPKM